MEIELKYLIKDNSAIGEIFKDEYILSLIAQGSKKVIPMEAIYYDTEDGDLQKEKAAYRIRKEGNEYVATVKWGGGSEKGLHTREEVNVKVDADYGLNPGIDCLEGTSAFEMYKAITSEKKLVPIVKMSFDRTEYQMAVGETLCIFSVDIGEIQGISKKESINEIEIELYSGKEEDMLIVGSYLQDKYQVEPCNVSKLSRGLSLNSI